MDSGSIRIAQMEPDTVTVMGPGGSSDTLNGVSLNPPPKFISGIALKIQYRDAMRRYIKILNTIAQSDLETKGLLNGAGHLIYLACDNGAQCILRQAEVNGRLNLSGRDTDPSIVISTSTIIKPIAKDSANERIQNELDCLENVYDCRRNDGESLNSYVNRFRGNVARFSIRACRISEKTSRHFGMLMIKNADLSPDTLSSFTLQLKFPTMAAEVLPTRVRRLTRCCPSSMQLKLMMHKIQARSFKKSNL